MRTERGTWTVASVLLFLGAVAGAGSVYQHWLPCRGSMLSGSVLNGYQYGADFSDGCLRAMDSGFGLLGSAPGLFSAESAFGTLAVSAFAAAWGLVVHSSRWNPTTKHFARLPAIATAATLLLNLPVVGNALGGFGLLLLLAPNLLALIAFIVIWLEEHPGPVVMLSVALALCASTAAGFVPISLDYAVMVSFSDANWDAPPGSGYLTVVGVAFLALILLVVTLVRTPTQYPGRRRLGQPIHAMR